MTRARSGAAALVLFIAGACASPLPRPEIASIVAGVERERLRAHVEALAGIGPRHGGDEAATQATLEWLEGQLADLGWLIEREHFEAQVLVMQPVFEASSASEPTHYEGLPEMRAAANLIAVRPGTRVPREVIEVAAHYDTVPGSPGADDNASGVAALLEIARVLGEGRTERTVRLCFFALEEERLLGSKAHVRILEATAGLEEHVGVLVLDMIGYRSLDPDSQVTPLRIPLLFSPPRTGDFILLAGNFRSGSLASDFDAAAARYVPHLSIFGVERLAAWFEGSDRGDHAPYWEAGLRAVTLTDTAEYRNPHYHLASDRPATLDYDFLADVTRAALAWTAEQAGYAPPLHEPSAAAPAVPDYGATGSRCSVREAAP